MYETGTAKSRGYYHKKVGSTPMTTTAPKTGDVHNNESALDSITSDKYTVHGTNIDQTREQFRGYGRVAQVLRWVSSGALEHSPGGNQKFTEVQAGFVGRSLIVGSNANKPNDSSASISAAIKTALTTDPGYNASASVTDESSRIGQQKRRHIAQLQEFVGNEDFFNAFVQQSVSEAHPNRRKAVARQLSGIRQSLMDLQSDKKDGYKVIDTNYQGSVNKSPNYHAEQRVLDYAIEHHDALMDEVAMSKSIDKSRIHKMRMVVSGTKPPCHRCRTTEDQRGMTNTSEQSKLKTYRFELESGPMFGAGGNGAFYSRHTDVQDKTHTALDAQLKGGGDRTKYQEPIMSTGSGFARARRDSVHEMVAYTPKNSTTSVTKNVGRR